jgi:hypothetical protein
MNKTLTYPFTPTDWTRDNINSQSDIQVFFQQLIFCYHISLHPDTNFSDYIFRAQDGNMKQLFRRWQVQVLQPLMWHCFELAAAFEYDIYEIAIDADAAAQQRRQLQSLN